MSVRATMEIPSKRKIFPIHDWDKFLKEGQEEFQKLYASDSNIRSNFENLELIKILGVGAFGRVYLSKLSFNDKFIATKVMSKRDDDTKRCGFNEWRILQALNFPFCTHLEYSFQDKNYLYLCVPFIAGGALLFHLKEKERLEEEVAKFYGAQVLLALEYLHNCGVVYRDLKTDNLLIDIKGYLKLTDYGFSKVIRSRTYTFCGTPEYLAPEIIRGKGYGKAVDWWSYGVLLYEMNAGILPFYHEHIIKLYENIVSGVYVNPPFFSKILQHLIAKLLEVDLTWRYGNLKGGACDIKHHPWFNGVDWISLFNGQVPAPFVPKISAENDTKYFEHIEEKKLKGKAFIIQKRKLKNINGF